MFASIILWFVFLACGRDCQLPQSIPLSPKIFGAFLTMKKMVCRAVSPLLPKLGCPLPILGGETALNFYLFHIMSLMCLFLSASISNPLSHTDADMSKGTLKSRSLKWSRLETFYEGGDYGFFVLFWVRGFWFFFFFVLIGVIFWLLLEALFVCVCV